MKHTYGKLYSDALDFFEFEGNCTMQLTPAAAKEVCELAKSRGYIVSRIEGGIWRNPGFESRLDCIWDRFRGHDNDPMEAAENAKRFIGENQQIHDVFIVSLQKYPHDTET